METDGLANLRMGMYPKILSKNSFKEKYDSNVQLSACLPTNAEICSMPPPQTEKYYSFVPCNFQFKKSKEIFELHMSVSCYKPNSDTAIKARVI